MKSYRCRICGNPLYFENSICVSCGTPLGYSRAERQIVPVDKKGVYLDADGRLWHVCRNLNLSGCTWLAPLAGGQCFSCDLTRTRPNNADAVGIARLLAAEQAKRHLITDLDSLGIPVIGRRPTDGGDPVGGLCFDLLSSTEREVVTGHDNGVVTIDLAEGDDAHRERIRHQLDEPYRTLLGHFRHEVGHYFEWRLVDGDPDRLERFRGLFGDERRDYQEALDRHYADGPPAHWQDEYISAYATMHPYEDFAETWAHYLHICDTVETAVEYGFVQPSAVIGLPRFRDLVTRVWVPVSTGLNIVNRSMGEDDLYPFVIPSPVLDKLDFVASLAHP